MLNATEAHAAFMIITDSGMGMVETDIAVNRVTDEFHEFLKSVYADELLTDDVEIHVWKSAWAGNEKLGYDGVEARYIENVELTLNVLAATPQYYPAYAAG